MLRSKDEVEVKDAELVKILCCVVVEASNKIVVTLGEKVFLCKTAFTFVSVVQQQTCDLQQ